MSGQWVGLTDFSRFVRCKKYFFLFRNSRPDDTSRLNTIHTSSRESRVISHARALFPEGIEVSNNATVEDRLARTEIFCNSWIKEFNGTIFSAWFSYGNIALFIDILYYNEGWHALAIQNRGGLSTEHSVELALQQYILQKNGIELKDFSIIYVNKKYIREEKIDPEKLFKIRSCIEDLTPILPSIEKFVEQIREPVQSKDIESIDIGSYCIKPAPCPFMKTCWQHIPDNSVFDIATLDRDSKFQLYKNGILLLKNIDLEKHPEFTPTQIEQVESAKQGNRIVHSGKLHEFLSTIHYPVHYLDFESIMPIIPLFSGTRPFQHIPMQYSLYEKKSASAEITLKEFLAFPPDNPSKAFINSLLQHLGKSGSIVVYDRRHEIRQLHELMQMFPELTDQIHSILDRIVDLILPFQKRLYYTPAMKGLSSLKSVLPALIPSLHYNNLPIKNGYMAMHALESLFYENNTEIISRTRSELTDYCKMDSFAMVKIHEFLVDAVNQDKSS